MKIRLHVGRKQWQAGLWVQNTAHKKTQGFIGPKPHINPCGNMVWITGILQQHDKKHVSCRSSGIYQLRVLILPLVILCPLLWKKYIKTSDDCGTYKYPSAEGEQISGTLGSTSGSITLAIGRPERSARQT